MEETPIIAVTELDVGQTLEIVGVWFAATAGEYELDCSELEGRTELRTVAGWSAVTAENSWLERAVEARSESVTVAVHVESWPITTFEGVHIKAVDVL